MVHAVSAAYIRFDRMSPPAAGMALLLHLTVALALWWVSPLKFTPSEPEPIEVTMEQPQPPKPAEAVPPPPAAQEPAPVPPAAAATPPPAPSAADKPKPNPKPLGLDPPPPAEQALGPQKSAPAPETKPEPEKELPKIETPAAPRTMQDFVKIVPPPAPQEVVPPLPRQVAPTPPPPPSRQAVKPSPLSPEATSPDNEQSSSSSFVNPANTAARARAHEDYITQVGRRLQQSRFVPKESYVYTRSGVIGVYMVVARDGQLLSSSVARSSGEPTFDVDMLKFIRSLSPYPPLPSALPGNQYSFTISIPYNLNPGR